ncbi:MAG: M20/M25/M40 family metallo-hydrolase [Kiritimatiellaeota bacterium]|nr:M20/M25/M40 family metallo-hydrolase [Kiritimatiellota bacterium]
MDIYGRMEEICSDSEFQEEIIAFLTEICEIDTTPNADVSVMREKETAVFEILEKRLLALTSIGGTTERKPVNPAIKDHPAFSLLHFTKTKERPEGLSAEEVYDGRFNLLFTLDGESSASGRNTAMNAHIDVVAPFIPPKREGDKLFGRGSIDDKGAVAAMIGALKVLNSLSAEGLVELKNKLTAMFVIEEETGGNGSLSLARDRELKKRYDSIMVLECADNRVYPANRGAVWFKCALSAVSDASVPLLETIVFAILAARAEGAVVKSESEHALFPHRPVQTCNGIIGPFGEHPSRICGQVVFELKCDALEESAIVAEIDDAIAEYISLYGDKTLETDPATNKPKVERHYEISAVSAGAFKITVNGSTGHMGSILENDDAILKFAHIARNFIELKYSKSLALELSLENFDSSKELELEGGQGFLPTHPIEQIMSRIENAFKEGVKEYLELSGASSGSIRVKVSYDKLHNAAFDGDPNSESFINAKSAGVKAGMIAEDAEIRGWDVSCDARLFATEYPGMPVITSGPGALKYAHADNENLHIPDLFKSIRFLVDFILKETGS